MTDVVSYRPKPDELCYTFGGREPVRRVRPGTVLELYTEDCFGGRVHGVEDLPSRVCNLSQLNPVPDRSMWTERSRATPWPCTSWPSSRPATGPSRRRSRTSGR